MISTTCADCGQNYPLGNGHLTTACIDRLKAQIAEKIEQIEWLRHAHDNPDDYPCPHSPDLGCPSCGPEEPCEHDSATGVGHITTPEWSGVIWECTSCHTLGEDSPNGSVVWAGEL
jgi:hypothetical protein